MYRKLGFLESVQAVQIPGRVWYDCSLWYSFPAGSGMTARSSMDSMKVLV